MYYSWRGADGYIHGRERNKEIEGGGRLAIRLLGVCGELLPLNY